MTPLHYIGDALREFFLMIPLPVAHVLFLALSAALLVWVLRLPREETTDPEGGGPAGNLKVWAAVALVIQIVIYLVL